MRLQRTIKEAVTFKGIGLHSGRLCMVTMNPASRDTGIIFVRKDRNIVIKAHVGAVVDTAFATTLGYNGTRVKTVEHLLSVLAGLGIDNLIIEVEGPEIPILDGSSTELVAITLKAGISKQAKKKSYIRITKPILLHDGNSKIMAIPYNGRRITYSISFKHSLFSLQNLSIDINEENFIRHIAPARTFGFLKNVELLRANGLAKGGSLDNAVVIGDEGILNNGGLRFHDEFVRHKILDLLGDLSLIGYPVYAHILAERAGHSTHIRFIRKVLSSIDSWDLIAEESELTHSYAFV
ncbi:UDP-3-O-[3-hydroxymyristoyl] N-acetylglucosamine deacetylase [bacterium BMS3Bbin06]|nr:UDP-3-O-[3-hydroxymyristoyl] N-acetylglucosamine deacetylase [bacterium BMS3Abin08]GBE34507.1 UDP-3-O-[3-hydroxymyristoyl] N-acetylglucosamine deacetylase [bacterium BMS3Bbin06]HDY72445.1 UDP-3-O-acyl-N-acetylglucosamine deacetylase [Nitrospirota bacterium]